MIDTTVISCNLTNTKNTNLLISVLLIVAPTSGGHINPIARFASPTRVLVYVEAKCLGAMLGAVALKLVVDDTMQHISLGGCIISPAGDGGGHHLTGIAVGNALLLEAICTFMFLFVPISNAFDHRRAQAHGASDG